MLSTFTFKLIYLCPLPILSSSHPTTNKWTKLADVPKVQQNYDADNLKVGEEYYLTVTGKNKVGSSEPLENDSVIPLSLNHAP